MNRSAFWLLICTCSMSAMVTGGADMQLAYASSSKSPSILVKDGVRIFRDVVYGTNDSVALKMDIRVPISLESNTAPVVIRIHGGSWSVGDKSGYGCVPAASAE